MYEEDEPFQPIGIWLNGFFESCNTERTKRQKYACPKWKTCSRD